MALRNNLNQKDYFEIDIIGDGNCFYRYLSMYFEKTQENYKYYRQIIFNYISNNKTLFIQFFAQKENENNKEYERRFSIYINNILSEGSYAGDFEISSASSVLNRNIIIYRPTTNNEYEYYNNYQENTLNLINSHN